MIRKIALALVLLFLATSVGAQSHVIRRPIFPAAGGGASYVAVYSNTGTGTSITVSIVNAGAGDLILVLAGWRNNGGQTISSVTYNGAGITHIRTEAPVAGFIAATSYYAINPGGTADVVVTWSAAIDGGGHVVVYVISGAHQTTPIQDHQSTSDTTASATSISTNVTSQSGGLVFDLVNRQSVTEALTVGADQTERYQGSVGDVRDGSSTEPGAATTTMSWSWTGGSRVAHIAVAVAPQ